ncbi:MAG: Ig-like domain-containing protein [Acidobacteriales bacterium]|nr:Ig-like domain-containing protein [Terriglobales bacterium]
MKNRGRFALLLIAALVLALLPACGHQQELVGITIQPSTEVFGSTTTSLSQDAQATPIPLIAYGTFIHPPVTKDITNQVVWTSNTTDVATVTSTGLLQPAGIACGNALISATVTTNSSDGGIHSSGALVTGTMTATVVCPTGP